MYGAATLLQVEQQSRAIAEQLGPSLPLEAALVWKPVLTGSAAIRRVCLDANSDDRCIGVITWMHTFSPAKMWIHGLDELRKPLLHLHTQFNEALPWSTIDMDFMNLNQAAHGDREFAHVVTRLSVPRKTVAGHVNDPRVGRRVRTWVRASVGAHALRNLRLLRFGDNMRNVAVTEGDKVEAEHRLGVSVNTFGVNDLVAAVDGISDRMVDAVVEACLDSYDVAPELRPGGERAESLRYAARIEAGLRDFLEHHRVPGLHDELRGPRWPAPTAGPGRATADGHRLRLRRRGRLEDCRSRAHAQGDVSRSARWHLVHGGLHLPPRPG